MKEKNGTLLRIIVYLLVMLAMGIWQITDWYFGSEDPIWHLFFYFLFIPFFSFVFGVVVGNVKRWYLVPLIAYFSTCAVYIFMANGGFSVDSWAFELSVIPLTSSSVGVIFRKMMEFLSNKF